MERSYPCLKIKQWGYGKGANPVFVYVTSMPLNVLARARIDRWSRENRYGYQRPPLESRFGKGRGSIIRYLLSEIGAFPTSVLINVRGDITYNSKEKITDEIELGEIMIPENSEMIMP